MATEPVSTAERELWSGHYSTKALAAAWILGGVLFVVLSAAAWFVCETWESWLVVTAVVAIPVAWVWLLGLYRRFTLGYMLTSQKLVVNAGLVNATINRVALLVVDDVLCKQSGLDRLFGIGSIVVISRDKTDPTLTLLGVEDVRNVTGLLELAVAAERQSHGAVVNLSA